MNVNSAAAAALAAALWAAASSPGFALEEVRCRTMLPQASLNMRLPGFSALAAAGKSIRIVAIGSSSTEGPRIEDRSGTYPSIAARELRAQWPAAQIEMINKGRGGETIADMLKRFKDDVIGLEPALAIWQLGANDVLRFDGVRGMEEQIVAGLSALREKGIPVVLFDLQYAPMIVSDPDHRAMEDLIERLAREHGAGLFRRFAIMRALIDGDSSLPQRVIESDGLHMTSSMHRCLGLLLASGISDAARPDLSAKK